MSPAGKGGKLSTFLLPCSSLAIVTLPAPDALASSLQFFADLPLESQEMLAPFSEGLTALLLLVSNPVKKASIGMTQMAVAEGSTQERDQNTAQW